MAVLAAAGWLVLSGCRAQTEPVLPTLEFTKVPAAGDGSPEELGPISGRVRGRSDSARVVVFAKSGWWWVQPTTASPFTPVRPDSTWSTVTHPGVAYAALLVSPAYHPADTMKEVPQLGGGVLAVAVAEGPMLKPTVLKTLRFSGYEWEIRQTSSDRGGTTNHFDPRNAWTDDKGFLHLRVAKDSGKITSAEVGLTRGLGYGSYRFTVEDVLHLEPAEVFSILTWDGSGPERELDVEISRWGEPASKNAQYIVQPYYIPANAVRFQAPGGKLTFLLRWEPGKATFKTVRGDSSGVRTKTIAEHIFTSGVPTPGEETIRMNHYFFMSEKSPLRNGSEVVVEKFEYLP